MNLPSIPVSADILYPLLACGLVLIIITVNYLLRSAADSFRRKVFLLPVAAVFAALITAFVLHLVDGKSRAAVLAVAGAASFFRIASFYLIAVFIDYLANMNAGRTRRLLYITCGIGALLLFIIGMNVMFGFYYQVNEAGNLRQGGFIIRYIFGFGAIIFAAVDLILSLKNFKQGQLRTIVIFAVFAGLGPAADFLFRSSELIWAFFTGALLFAYLQIIGSDSTRDNATGISNRSGFNEFVSRIERAAVTQSYAMALFDINGLRKINSEFGDAEGDAALGELGEILRRCTRESDFIARLGGDEFIVAIKARYDITKLLARFLRMLENFNRDSGKEYKLSISYGYDTYDTHSDQTIDEFLTHLNTLVFRHKSDQKAAERE